MLLLDGVFNNTLTGSEMCWNQSHKKDTVIRATFHHNIYRGGVARAPKLRFGKLHFYNNYVKEWGWSAIELHENAQGVIENNIFDKKRTENTPDEELFAISTDTTQWDTVNGFVCETGNKYLNDAVISGEGYNCDKVFNPSIYYSYVKVIADDDLIKDLTEKSGRVENPQW